MRATKILGPLFALALAGVPVFAARTGEDEALLARIRERCQPILDDLVERGVPGVSAALVLPDGARVTLTAGHSSVENGTAMEPTDGMLSGSTGKTYVTAAAHHLVQAGKLALDAKAARYFEGAETPWLDRLPNGREVTLRQLLRHESGIPRYVFDPAFAKEVMGEPDRKWRPADLLAFVFDDEPLFAPGEGWSYADTNYIVVGMVIEKVAGTEFYAYVNEHFVEPFELSGTRPSNSRRIPGLIQGYIVVGRQLGAPARMLEGGACTFNPQFEWCGGGWSTTPLDLARWARILYGGEALEGPYLDTLLDGVEARSLGRGVKYGLGAMLRDTDAGKLVYHDGFMPGYLTSMGWFPESEIAVALQTNTDDSRKLGARPSALLSRLAGVVQEELAVTK